MKRVRLLGIAGIAAHWGPMVMSVGALRRKTLPTLAGIAPGSGVALTYDDGPDGDSTPHFLELLNQHDATATFFLLGSFVVSNASLVQEMACAGHELAVHGWNHQCLAWKRPGLITEEIRRTKELVEDLTGKGVGWYRPPYGVMTGEGLLAARLAGLHTVLWSSWGRDWERRATPQSIVDTVTRTLEPGGTVLLHDSDRTSAPGSWRATLSASEDLLRLWAARGMQVSCLRAHLQVPDSGSGTNT